MNKKFLSLTVAVTLAILQSAHAQGTAFTYQGRLDDSGNPANGTYDLTFALFDLTSGGGQHGNVITNSAVAISNGLFTVTLDFGNQFTGADRWLEVGVRTNGGGEFSVLSPRHLLVATPYAVRAANAATAASASSVNAANISGTLAQAQLPLDVALRTGGNNFTGTQFIAGTGPITGALYVNSPGFGTAASILRARATDQFPFAAQSFGGVNLLLVDTNGTVSVSGTLSANNVAGNGSGLTSLNATNLTGTVADARLSGNVAMRSVANTFNGNQTLNGEQTVNGNLNLNTPSYPGVTAFIRARPGDNLPLAVQGTNGVNYLLVATNGITLSSTLYVSGVTTIATNLNVSGEIFGKAITLSGGADLAEPFHMSDGEIPKGSVVVIDEVNPGQLKLSARAYDTRVAGVVSGANGVNPGLSLSQKGVFEGGQNVALTGRVYVRADATYAPIHAGDLLTTSETLGHAMKVVDHAKSPGAVIGKAMSTLTDGQGFVLVLVSLQ